MRKIIAIALCLMMLFCVVACTDNTETVGDDTTKNTSAATEEKDTSANKETEKPVETQVGTDDWTKLY